MGKKQKRSQQRDSTNAALDVLHTTVEEAAPKAPVFDPITPQPKTSRRTPGRADDKGKTKIQGGTVDVETVDLVHSSAAADAADRSAALVTTVSKRQRRYVVSKSIVEEPSGRSSPVEALAEETEDIQVETTVDVKKTVRRRRDPDPLPCKDPSPELLVELLSNGFVPGPLPIPNLGYACLNMDLRELKPPVFTSRDCIQRTLQEKGLEHLGSLTLSNCRDLARLIQWNHEHDIRLFRMSSVLQPWMGVHSIHSLPQLAEITAALRFAGDLARAYDQRITFHPSHFVKLAAPDDELVTKSIAELEGHSTILDLMGYEPSPWNKINVHIGGVYGDKQTALDRFAANYRRLSPACAARLTVENDDVASAFSLEDLLSLHAACGIPLVFDFHHHKFCPGSLSEEKAFKAAVATWPAGVRPVVHWSESQRGRKPHAHSDYVKGPIYLHGLEDKVDVMIEAKCKERALICYRDKIPIPESPDEKEPDVPADAYIALRLL